jgi:hypothetical protein
VIGSVYSATWTGGRTESTSSSFTHTGQASVWAVFNTGIGDTIFTLGYNNVQFNNGHAFINYAASSFTLPQTDGEFRLTNIPAKYQGGNYYAILVGACVNPPVALYGIKDATSTSAFKGFKISGSTVAIPVFTLSVGEQNFGPLTGTVEAPSVTVIIQNEEDFDFLAFSAALAEWDGTVSNYPLPALLYTDIQFTNGKTTDPIDYDDGQKVGDLAD